jgi:aryl-alcohol dehydrogenase-like predicted oxidoreductase
MTLRPGPYEQLVHEQTFRALADFELAARERGTDMATLALAWALAHPAVTAIVVGPRRPEHLEPALRALELELSAAERDELGSLFS